MPFFMQCPYCQNKIELPFTAVRTTCPNCLNNFRVDHLDEAFSWEASSPSATTGTDHKPQATERVVSRKRQSASKPASKTALARKTAPEPDLPQPIPSHLDKVGSIPAWFSPWGLAGFALAVLALLLASVVGVRILTITLAAFGVAVVVQGIRATRHDRQTKARVSLALGGTMSGAILVLALFAPKVINSRWAIDFAVPPVDPNRQVLVPRDQPRHEGRVLSDEEWVDAAKKAIRQDDVLVRIESFQADRLADRGQNRYLLVHLRLGNSGQGRSIAFAGFSKDKHQPVLTDDSGQRYPFLEQRPRKITKGPPVFEVSVPRVVEVPATGHLDHLLVFEALPAKVKAWKLEVPASAWGRTGVCRFRFPGFFVTAKKTVGLPWLP